MFQAAQAFAIRHGGPRGHEGPFRLCDTKSSLLLCHVAEPRRHLPFCRQFPTGMCGAGNGGVRSSRHNVASPGRVAQQGVSPARDSQHQRGRALGTCGTVNLREALLNVVMSNKRKVLARLGQKARGQVQGLSCPPAQMTHHRRKGAT